MKTVRTRFAPSPTGNPHIGNMRTALFSYLYAKHHGGVFVLRLEDTDRTRYVENGLKNILDALQWLSIVPDEGPSPLSGNFGPYIQSERLHLYEEFVQKLLSSGNAYYCFCTQERLSLLRKNQSQAGTPPRYDRHCRALSVEQQEIQKKNNLPFVIRMKIPDRELLEWHDLIHGKIAFQSDELDDQVLLKSDGYPTYHLANVVDDHLMEISHVIRSDEWISSTPKHLLLYRYFQWEPPQFAHVPMVLNQKRAKLSKRDGETALLAYQRMGYLPQAVLNFMAFLGWNPKTDQEIFSLEELVASFDLEKVNKAGAIFNQEKLDWYNASYIRKLPLSELTSLCRPFFQNQEKKSALFDDFDDREYLSKVVSLFQERLKRLSEIPLLADFFFQKHLQYDGNLLLWKEMSIDSARANLLSLHTLLKDLPETQWGREALEKAVKSLIERLHLTNGEVLWPFRVALSGQKASPGPFEMAEVFGKDRTLLHLEDALSRLE